MKNTDMGEIWREYLYQECTLTSELTAIKSWKNIQDFLDLKVISISEPAFETIMRKVTAKVLASVPSQFQHYIFESAHHTAKQAHHLTGNEQSLPRAAVQALYIASIAHWYQFFMTKKGEKRVADASTAVLEILRFHSVTDGMIYAITHLIRMGHLITGEWLEYPETFLEFAYCANLLAPLMATDDAWLAFAHIRHFNLTFTPEGVSLSMKEYTHTRHVYELMFHASSLEVLPDNTYLRAHTLSNNIPTVIEQLTV